MSTAVIDVRPISPVKKHALRVVPPPALRPPEQLSTRTVPSRDLALDYLRAFVTLVVLAHHSLLAYATWAVQPGKNLFKALVPVVDSTRWMPFDYVLGFNDVFFMTLMFFVSGLFVYPAVQKYGALSFIRDRALRLGLPFVFSVLVINPIGFYAAWHVSGNTTGFFDMYRHLAAFGFAPGPAWFIWVLLVYDIFLGLAIPAVFRRMVTPPLRSFSKMITRRVLRLRERPVAGASVMIVLSATAYLPMAYHLGFGHWINFVTAPFTMQSERFFLYLLWFSFGALVGAHGLKKGLLARDGLLARHAFLWLLAGFVLFNALWFVPTWLWNHHLLLSHVKTPPAILWVLTCVTCCFALIGIFLRVRWTGRRWMQSLARSAYGIYLVHAIFCVWLQRLLLYRAIHPFFKASAVFAGTVLLSWLTTQIALRIPRLKTII